MNETGKEIKSTSKIYAKKKLTEIRKNNYELPYSEKKKVLLFFLFFFTEYCMCLMVLLNANSIQNPEFTIKINKWSVYFSFVQSQIKCI